MSDNFLFWILSAWQVGCRTRPSDLTPVDRIRVAICVSNLVSDEPILFFGDGTLNGKKSNQNIMPGYPCKKLPIYHGGLAFFFINSFSLPGICGNNKTRDCTLTLGKNASPAPRP